MTADRPSSIPESLVVELSRAKVLPGAGDEADRWIRMLNGLDDSPHQIDRDHDAQARRTKEPGWVEAEPQVLMLPEPVRASVLAWALRPSEPAG